ncbi:hypothetical protein OG21DRAFT_1500929 [Imleria badia]|nr:hypothetical protein OG21DRAFT_1500929 [Imleria badia]
MRFSFFTVLSGLAALVVVSALPAESLQPVVRSGEVPTLGEGKCCALWETPDKCLIEQECLTFPDASAR